MGNGYASLTATPEEGTEIPAGTAVVLINSIAAIDATVGITSGLNTVVSESANLLKGTLVPMPLDLSDETNNYTLGQVDGNVGFYKFANNGTTSITLGANKAYLDTSTPSGNVKGVTFSFGDEDGIKSMDDGLWTMDNVQIYNVAGQRLSRPQRGVNNVNGKKVLVK